jgi:hypothetical protein
MSSSGFRDRAPKHLSRQRGRAVHRRWLLWLLAPVLLVAAIPAILYMRSQGSAAASGQPARKVPTHSMPMQPADRFMQSIVAEDGALGWRQLCPNVQAQLPLDELVQQANEQRAALQQHSVRLSMQFVGSVPRQGGGSVRIYAVTAHWPDGSTQQRTYSVYTQLSGCVEDVQSR